MATDAWTPCCKRRNANAPRTLHCASCFWIMYGSRPPTGRELPRSSTGESVSDKRNFNTVYMKKLHTLLIVCFVWGFGFSASAQKTKQLIILQTSDVHSRIEPINQKGDKNYKEGGFVRRATFLNRFRKENEHVLLFDCGDFSQGTPYYNIYKGEVEVKLMNEMGYDACTIGNHEFDFGLENMARLFKMAAFPIVCSNYDLENTPLKGLVKPYIILERFGLRIGVFGQIGRAHV